MRCDSSAAYQHCCASSGVCCPAPFFPAWPSRGRLSLLKREAIVLRVLSVEEWLLLLGRLALLARVAHAHDDDAPSAHPIEAAIGVRAHPHYQVARAALMATPAQRGLIQKRLDLRA